MSPRPSKSRRPILRADEAPILEGDCLELMALAREAIGAEFDLVYVDPPFNAGGVRGARAGAGDRTAGPAAYRDSWGGLDRFLEMLEPRIAAMREVMSDRGSLWLHLDHRTVHDAKVAADRVFGRGAFRGEIVWVPGNGSRSRRGPGVTHQTILIYARGREIVWNADDEALREPFASTSLSMHFRHKDAEGRHYRDRTIGGKTYRYYADKGRRIGSVWTDCPAMNANTPLTRETTGYPTQKPESLLSRIVRAASLPGSAVLDPMCGSGTTIAVAQHLGRRAIGIDRSPVACEIARRRVGGAGSGSPTKPAARKTARGKPGGRKP